MWEIRTIGPDDVDLFRSRLSRGFGQDFEDTDAARERFEKVFEYDRTFAVFEDGDIVGTGAAFSLGLTVPGGAEVPMGGTTVIAVQPTHRRRGILRELMARHLDEVASRGEPVAGLWASESTIYGRFGYGPATYRYKTKLDAPRLQWSGEAGTADVRLMESKEAQPIVRALWEVVRTKRPGMITRSDGWWEQRVFADVESWRGGKTAFRYAVFQDGDTPTGYAMYRQKSSWENFIANGEVEIEEFLTTSDVAHEALWRFLTNIDLFPKVEFWSLPIDDPLPGMVGDPRRMERVLSDALWVRLMDVPTALEARTYEDDGSVTISVTDGSRPETSGTYQLDVTDGSATCERIDGEGELSCDIDVLGHLYLGGGSALVMAAAGRLRGDTEAVGRVHRIFRSAIAPWSPEVF